MPHPVHKSAINSLSIGEQYSDFTLNASSSFQSRAKLGQFLSNILSQDFFLLSESVSVCINFISKWKKDVVEFFTFQSLILHFVAALDDLISNWNRLKLKFVCIKSSLEMIQSIENFSESTL